MVILQRAKTVAHMFGLLPRGQTGLRIGAFIRAVGNVSHKIGAAAFAMGVDHLSIGDAEYPCLHFRSPFETAGGTPHLHEYVMEYVAGLERIVQSGADKSENRLFQCPVKRRQRLPVAIGHAGQQRGLGLIFGHGVHGHGCKETV